MWYTFKESSCLGLQLKMGGKFHLKLNTGERPIANKYREGKMKRTLKRELNSAWNCWKGNVWHQSCVQEISLSRWGVVGVWTARPAFAAFLFGWMHFSVCRSTSVLFAGQNPKGMWQLWLCYSSGAIRWTRLRLSVCAFGQGWPGAMRQFGVQYMYFASCLACTRLNQLFHA